MGVVRVKRLCQDLHCAIEFRPGRKMLAIMRWPALGANLNLASARAGVAEIEFVRDHFAVSEAMTYYEFTLDSAIARGV